MPAPYARQDIKEVPLNIVGGNKFGRYNKISNEETFNMIVSDGFLVPYAGYSNKITVSPAVGRGIYQSNADDAIYMVCGSLAYRIDKNFDVQVINQTSPLLTDTGDVFISENNNAQIVITDYKRVYVYNYAKNTKYQKGQWLQSTTASVTDPSKQFSVSFDSPGYVSFQNGRMIIANYGSQNWYLSDENEATSWPNDARHVGALQSKPDTIQACVPAPGAGNNLLVFGHNVIELWQDLGKAKFPYQRNSTFNIDFGCLNASSIAAMDDSVVWLSANEQSGATLMQFKDNNAVQISTDGMDFKFASLSNPNNCTGFLFRQDGHLGYQFTFPEDNLSYFYDFETQMFFTLTDENFNYHIAQNVVFYNNYYYFASLNDGVLYEFGTQFTNYKYSDTKSEEIPRVRICPPFRLPTQRYFIIKSVGFTVENGRPNAIEVKKFTSVVDLTSQDGNQLITQDGNLLITNQGQVDTVVELASECVDLSISRDGAENFGASIRLNMNPTGKRQSRFIWQRLGRANDVTLMFTFWGYGRFLATDGLLELYE